jgi:predicted TIM-barrel fold metal-dependent hydrolase
MTAETIPFPGDRSIPPIAWRPPAGTRVISADDHYQEPAGLYQDRLPSKYKDRAPQIFQDENGNWEMTIGGETRASKGIAKTRSMNKDRRGGHDLAARLADMDAELVDKSLCFPQKSMPMLGMPDKDLVFACCDVYNEWLASVQRDSGGRIVGVAILPTIYRVEATRDYIAKIRDWGFKAMQIPSAPSELQYNRSAMEPLWDAIEERGIPLSLHVRGMPTSGAGAFGADLTTSFQPFRRLLATFLFSGILERHPGLRLVFTEGGIGWVPGTLYDADKIYRQYGSGMTPKLANPPSYYWFRQCYSTFMDDPCGIELIDRMGADHAMWSLDYPHPEGVLGEAVALMKGYFETLGPEKAKLLVGGNAARVWGI